MYLCAVFSNRVQQGAMERESSVCVSSAPDTLWELCVCVCVCEFFLILTLPYNLQLQGRACHMNGCCSALFGSIDKDFVMKNGKMLLWNKNSQN